MARWEGGLEVIADSFMYRFQMELGGLADEIKNRLGSERERKDLDT